MHVSDFCASEAEFPSAKAVIPLYLLAGLAFGNGGLAPLRLSENFDRIGAEIGVLLLLFMLGLEYSGDELKESLRAGLPAGVADFVLNFTPGLMAGFLFGWHRLAAVLLGPGAAIRCGTRSVYDLYEGAERVLGRSSRRDRLSRTLAGGHGTRGTRRVLTRNNALIKPPWA